ncbi:MAG: response regulator transcription factor [Oscillospiraceae bacterium]
MKKILIVEDDRALANGICLALKTEEISPLACHSISAARDEISSSRFDLFILDLNLPDGNGLNLLASVRGKSPVILLTANDLETDIVAGLESGADDYITKPFSLAVLRARVNAQLRKASERSSGKVELGSFVFDFDRLEYSNNGQAVELSKTEQKLLKTLVENRGRTLERAVLVDRIWTDGAEYVDENALSVTVKRLRDKLEDIPSNPVYIKTIYGIGYTWAVT